MKVRRYFCKKSVKKNQAIIEGEEFFHFKNVMRGKTGDGVEIINGKGSLHHGKIARISSTQAFVQIQKTKMEDPPPIKIIIAPSLLKTKPMNEMIEKLSEMGIDEIRPVIYNRTDSKPLVSRKEKWNKIAQQALKVNKKLWQTNIFEPVKVEEIIGFSKHTETKLLLDLNGSEPSLPKLFSPIISVIGPPGDLTHKERDIFIKNGFIPIKINDCILRSETAAIAIAAILKKENLS
jgi:16S rRNA (uracil1498-N3)-methyltransferase